LIIAGSSFQLQHGGWELRRAAPLLGQHTAEVLREAGLNDEAIARASGGAA
jgi:crotonobetainyl-CoA:carnitine CoA-transferase CaiB-like acyl-CoA transferase